MQSSFETSNDNSSTAGFLEHTRFSWKKYPGNLSCSIIRRRGFTVIRYKLSLRRDKGLESLGHWFPRENSIVKQSVVRGVEGRGKGGRARDLFFDGGEGRKFAGWTRKRFDSSLLWFRRCRRFEGDSSHGIRESL